MDYEAARRELAERRKQIEALAAAAEANNASTDLDAMRAQVDGIADPLRRNEMLLTIEFMRASRNTSQITTELMRRALEQETALLYLAERVEHLEQLAA